MGIAALGLVGRAERVRDGERRGLFARGPGEVVREGGEVVRTASAQHLGQPGVQSGPAHADEVGVQGVADQRVREPDHAGRRFGQQPGHHTRLDGVQHGVLVVPRGVRGLHEDADLYLAAHHGGQLEDAQRTLGQLPQPTPQHVTHALRDLGHRHQGALAGEQPRALPDVEGVAVGPVGERADGRRVDLLPAHRPDQGVHIRQGQSAEGQPVRRAVGECGERLRQPLPRVGRAVRGDREYRRSDQLGGPFQQGQRLAVGPVQVVHDHGQRCVRGGLPQPGAERPVQPEPSDGRRVVPSRESLRHIAAGHGLALFPFAVAGLLEQGAERGRVGGRGPAGERAERLHPGPSGRGAVELGAAADHDGPALLPQPPLVPTEQRRLAGPGVAGHQDHTAAPSGLARHFLQGPQFVVPAHEQFVVRQDDAHLIPHSAGRRTPIRRRRVGHHRFQGFRRRCLRRYRRTQELGASRQHGPFQLGQRAAEPQAEFVGQHVCRPPQFGHRVGAASTGPQPEGQQPPALLAQRVLPYERLGSRHRLPRSPRGEGRGDRHLPRRQVQFVQPGGLGRRPLLVRPLAVRRSVPPPERLLQQTPGLCPAGPASPPYRRLEPPGVDRVLGQPQRVPGRGTDQDAGRGAGRSAGFERAPQVGHVDMQGGRRLLRGPPPPQTVDESVDGHHTTPVGQQEGEDGPLPGTSQVDRRTVDVRADGSQDLHVEHDPSIYSPDSLPSEELRRVSEVRGQRSGRLSRVKTGLVSGSP